MGDGDDLGDRMCRVPSKDDRGIGDRGCYLPGKEPLSFDPFRLTDEAQSSFMAPTPTPAPTWSPPTLADAKADRARAEQNYRQLLDDAGITDKEFTALAAYVRQSKEMKYTPTDDDLANFVLSQRPAEPRFPGVVDPRGYRIWGATGFAFLSNPTVQAVVVMTLDIALDCVPVLGEVKMVAESVIGRSALTGDKIPTWARILGPLGAAAGHARQVVGFVSKAAKLVRGLARAARLQAGLKVLAPLLALVAHTRAAPAEALRVLDRLAQVDQAALKVAKVEAEGARGVLAVTRAQQKALTEASALLSADEIAAMERNQARMTEAARDATKAPAKAPARPSPDTEALAAESKRGRQQPRVGGKKPSPRRRPDPTRVFNRVIRAASKAYDRLWKKGLKRQDLTYGQLTQPHFQYQKQVTGKEFEYVIQHPVDGRMLQIDGLADSMSAPGKLDVIEAKFGYVDDIGDSAHLTFGGQKVDQMERLAQFAASNPDEIGKVIVVVSDTTVGEVYLGLREMLSTKLRGYVEVVDEALKPITKTK